MKYLKNMKHIYAERLFGVAVGLFIAAILIENRQTTYGTIMSVYLLVAIAIISSLVMGIMAYIEGDNRQKTDQDVHEQ
jgi:hypothetical protein